MKTEQFELKLKGKTCVMVDWANVYGWSHKLKKEVDIKKLYEYLKKYSKVEKINFYFGEDKTNLKSAKFLDDVKKTGYSLIKKEVKFIKIYDEEGKNYFLKRKCDFDLEIGLDSMELIDKFDSFVFFSGDGDFKTLYERLLKTKKQIIVIFGRGSLGREIVEMKGVFLCDIEKNIPSVLKPKGVIRSIISKKKKNEN